MKYLVEIIPESITDVEAATSKLASTLKLEPAKAAALLKRNPVTKPVSLAEAEKVAKLFNKAGIEVFVRSEEEHLHHASHIHSRTETLIQHAKQPDVVQLASRPSVDPPLPPLVSKATPAVLASTVTQARGVEHQKSSVAQISREDLEPSLEPAPVTAKPKVPSVVPETQQAPSMTTTEDPFQTKTIQGAEPLSIPSGFFTPVPEGAVTPAADSSSPALTEETKTQRGGLGKIAFASIVPGLLALVGLGAALYVLGLPFLQGQQRAAAETTAVSLASSLGGWIGDVSLNNPVLSQQVQNVITRTQTELQGHDIDFVLLTDAEGNQLAGWYKEAQGVPEAVALSQEVKGQISNALGVATSDPQDPSAARLSMAGEVLGLASAAVRQGDTPVGAVVVGSSEQSLMAKLQAMLPTLGLAGVLPLVLGMLVSFLVGRNRS